MKYAIMPPITRSSWKKPTRNPRIARGEFSATYVGASMVPAPSPIPSMNLKEVYQYEGHGPWESRLTVRCRKLGNGRRQMPA